MCHIVYYVNRFPLFHFAFFFHFFPQFSYVVPCCKCENNIHIIWWNHIGELVQYKKHKLHSLSKLKILRQFGPWDVVWCLSHTQRHILKVKLVKRVRQALLPEKEKRRTEPKTKNVWHSTLFAPRTSDMCLLCIWPPTPPKDEKQTKGTKKRSRTIKTNKPKICTIRNVCLVLFQHEIYIIDIFCAAL